MLDTPFARSHDPPSRLPFVITTYYIQNIVDTPCFAIPFQIAAHLREGTISMKITVCYPHECRDEV